MRYEMRLCRRAIVALMVVVLSTISGAYSGSVSTGGGTSRCGCDGSSAEGILASDGTVNSVICKL